MILMKVGFGATILINGYKFSSGSSMASIPYVQDNKKPCNRNGYRVFFVVFFSLLTPTLTPYRKLPRNALNELLHAGGAFLLHFVGDMPVNVQRAAVAWPRLLWTVLISSPE